ncbi:acyl-CoA dehydrogenase family protein [Streptomyces sp. JW3]|uniref:acyl-CoA dehydrogenase family protein n=1 Tax=Streptomyces sp. JW3 TaxID=3456955 RepID=UPI003FA432E6
MSSNNVRDTVVATVARVLDVTPEAVAGNGALRSYPTFNSFRAMEIVERLEDDLEVQLDPGDLTPDALSQVDVLSRRFERLLGLTTAAAPDDIAALVERVRTVVRAHAADTDRDAVFPEAALAELRETGLLGLTVPVEYGGLGAGTDDMLRVAAQLSRDCMSVGMIFAMHCQQTAALVEHAAPALRSQLLPRVAKGELYLASVTTEAGKGGHLLTSGAPLTADADTLHLDRLAPVVTGGAHADGYLITMQAPGTDSDARVSLVYADRQQLGTTVTGGWDPLGMRATHSVPMRLTGDLPADQVVGEHGGAREIILRTFGPLAHLGWSACWLGTADGALARTVRSLRSGRERRDLESELLRRRLSRVRQRLDSVHALISHASGVVAGTADLSAPPVQLLLNAVKLTASEQCLAAVDELVELAGLRHGYQRTSPLALERALRDLRSASLNYGNDRLHAADGALVLMDQDVHHV